MANLYKVESANLPPSYFSRERDAQYFRKEIEGESIVRVDAVSECDVMAKEIERLWSVLEEIARLQYLPQWDGKPFEVVALEMERIAQNALDLIGANTATC